MSCPGHQYEGMCKFIINSDEAVTRSYTTCSCYCPKCNADHYCLKPQFFVKADFEGDVPWCCMQRVKRASAQNK